MQHLATLFNAWQACAVSAELSLMLLFYKQKQTNSTHMTITNEQTQQQKQQQRATQHATN